MNSSGASAAPTVSAFMAIALAGSTTEPVISHSTRKVSAHSSSTASAQPGADRGLLVDELRRRAGHGGRERRVERADLGTTPRAVSPAGSPGTVTVDPPGVAPRSAGARPRYALQGVDAIGERADAAAPSEAARRRDGDGRRAGAAEVALDRVGDDRARSCPPGSRSRRPASTSRRGPAARRRASRAAVTAAITPGRRMTAWASRCQRSCAAAAPRRAARACAPQSASSAGETASEASAATTATLAPAMPIDCANPSGNTVSVASAAATVAAREDDGAPGRAHRRGTAAAASAPSPAPRGSG